MRQPQSVSYIQRICPCPSCIALSNILGSAAVLAALVLALAGCGINNIPRYEQQVTGRLGQVQNEYQRRADLVPNLVATVKGYATHEDKVLKR